MNILKKIYNRLRRLFKIKEWIINKIINSTRLIKHKGVSLHFAIPNDLCDYRARSFSTKEPDTLRWIESFNDNCIFWDIGANIGVYSLYAAKAKNATVWAFEPSVFNIEFLSRNINLNKLNEKIFILPVALNNRIGFNMMKHSSTAWGGALSAFDKEYGYDGKSILNLFSYNTLGLTLDFVVSELKIPLPDYIKIDVDGIEHLILEGGVNSIKYAKQILLEINEDFNEQSNSAFEILTSCGFTLKNKGDYHHPKINIANQIWVNKSN